MNVNGSTRRVCTGFAAICTLLGGAGCGAPPEEADSAEMSAEVEGVPIPIEGDPGRATYQLVTWSEMPNGHREALTRRDGQSGTSYSRREIDCEGRRFRYLGEGDTRAEAEEDAPNRGEMGELVPGSISTEVSEFVCQQ